MGTRRQVLVIAGACVLVAAGVLIALLILTRHAHPVAGIRGTPTPTPAVTASRPEPTSVATPAASHSASPTPSRRAASPSPGGSAKASPAPTPTPAASRAATPAGPPVPTPTGGLVSGAYGFSYPAGWSPGPLVTVSSQAVTETVSAPSSEAGSRIDYLKDTSTHFYNPDRTIDDTAVEVAIESELPCSQITAVTPVPDKGFSYTCSAPGGLAVFGMALVAPYPGPVRLLQVQVPSVDTQLAASILATFH